MQDYSPGCDSNPDDFPSFSQDDSWLALHITIREIPGVWAQVGLVWLRWVTGSSSGCCITADYLGEII